MGRLWEERKDWVIRLGAMMCFGLLIFLIAVLGGLIETHESTIIRILSIGGVGLIFWTILGFAIMILEIHAGGVPDEGLVETFLGGPLVWVITYLENRNRKNKW